MPRARHPFATAVVLLFAGCCLLPAAPARNTKASVPAPKPAPLLAPVVGDLRIRPGAPPRPHPRRELAGVLGGDLASGLAGAALAQRLEEYRAAGCSFVRLRVDWSRVQPANGPYQWRTAEEPITQALAKGLGVVAVLGSTPTWASRGKAGYTVVERQRMVARDTRYWRAFVTSAVRHFKDRVRYWQIWERPVIQSFRGTQGDYAALVAGASQAARAEDPSCRLILPEGGQIDLAAVDLARTRPSWAQFDILGLAPPAVEAQSLVRPLATLAGLAPGGLKKEVWITEWSFPGSEQGAAQLARSFTMARAPGVSRAIVAFGGSRDGAALRALAPLARAWSGRYQGYLESGKLEAYAFARAEQTDLVAWGQADQPGRLCLEAKAQEEPAAAEDTHLELPAEAQVSVCTEGEPGPPQAVQPDGLQVPVSARPVLVSVTGGMSLEAFQQQGQPARPQPQVNPEWVRAEAVTAYMEDTLWVEKGLYNERLRTRPGGDMHIYWSGEKWALRTTISSDDSQDNAWYYFDVDDSFLYFDRGKSRIQITVEVRGATAPQQQGFNMFYDSVTGYRFSPWQWVAVGPGWFTYQTVLTDASFANRAGYDFRLSATGSREDMWISRVEVRKLDAASSPLPPPVPGPVPGRLLVLPPPPAHDSSPSR